MQNYHSKKKEKNPFHSKSFQLFNEPKSNNIKLNAINEKFIYKKLKTVELLSDQAEQTNRADLQHQAKQEEQSVGNNFSIPIPAFKTSSLIVQKSTEQLMSDFRLFLQPLSTNNSSSGKQKGAIRTEPLNNIENVQNFYIKKMNDFGFNGFKEECLKEFESRSEPNFGNNSNMVKKSSNTLNEEKFFSGLSTMSINSLDSDSSFNNINDVNNQSFVSSNSIIASNYYKNSFVDPKNGKVKGSDYFRAKKLNANSVTKFYSPSLIICKFGF